MPSYLDSVTFRTRTGVSTSIGAEVLDPVLNAAEYAVEKYLGYDPTYQTFTEYYDGDGTDRLVLRHRPVVSVTSVHEDWEGYYQSANFTSDDLLTSGTDYVLEAPAGTDIGILRRIGKVWPYRRQRLVDRLALEKDAIYGCVKVIYVAGLTPPDLAIVREAAYLTAAAMWAVRSGIGPKASESLDGYSFSLMNLFGTSKSGMPTLISQPAAALLQPLKRIVIG